MNNSDLKQVIVIRRDLKMRRGKEIVQGAHVSMKAVLENIDNPKVIDWLNGNFRKICVYVKSEQELLEIYQKAIDSNIIAAVIEDLGFTEFKGIATKTAVCIGPDLPENIDKITGDLPMY